jgi:zinc protease
MLLRGTRKNSREQLRNRFDKLNANVAVDGDGGSIETVRESLPEALRLMAEVLRQPSFPADEFEQLRRATLTGIDTQRSDPSALASLALTRHLNPYPPSAWLYTTSLDERTARLKGLTLEDVKRCYEDFYGASDAELSVVGDFDPEQIKRLAQELFGDWKSPKPYARIPLKVADVAPVDHTIETPDKANAVLRAGVLLRLRDDDPDYPALVLANYILGGSSDSRLVRRIREKEGLSYSVGSFVSADSFYARGAFGISAIYAPQNRSRVEAALSDEIRKAFADGFTAQEVEAGKKGLLQARQLARSNDSAVAGRLVSYLVLGRTFSWDEDLERKIAALTPEAVKDALRRRIDPAKLSFVKAGDFAKVAAAPAAPARPD